MSLIATMAHRLMALFCIGISRQQRPKDEADFAACLPRLSEPARRWLRDAVSLLHPGHPLRGFIERNKPGACYIYFNYGVHWMLNVLVKGGPRNGLILIRALEPKRGINLMRARRGLDDVKRLCSGPGNLTQALDINSRHHELDLCNDPQHHFLPRESADISVVADPRIGISRSKEHPWRFTLRDSPFVSRLPKL